MRSLPSGVTLAICGSHSKNRVQHSFSKHRGFSKYSQDLQNAFYMCSRVAAYIALILRLIF